MLITSFFGGGNFGGSVFGNLLYKNGFVFPTKCLTQLCERPHMMKAIQMIKEVLKSTVCKGIHDESYIDIMFDL